MILWTPNLLKHLAHTWLVVQILATKSLTSSGPPKICDKTGWKSLTNFGSPKNNVTKQDEKFSPILDPPLPSDSLLPTEREETRLPSILKSKRLLCLDFLWKLLLEGTESNSILQLPTPSTSSSILCFGSGFCFGFSVKHVLFQSQNLCNYWVVPESPWFVGPCWFFLVPGGSFWFLVVLSGRRPLQDKRRLCEDKVRRKGGPTCSRPTITQTHSVSRDNSGFPIFPFPLLTNFYRSQQSLFLKKNKQPTHCNWPKQRAPTLALIKLTNWQLTYQQSVP